MTENKNLYHKLALIQSQLSGIKKGAYNAFQKYYYFTESQALLTLKPLFSQQKLALTFSDSPQSFELEKGEKEWVVKYLKKAIFTNAENPTEQLTFHFWAVGSNADPAKAKGAAETYAIKYFLSKFFLLPVVDNLDPDQADSNRNRELTPAEKQKVQEILTRHKLKSHA